MKAKLYLISMLFFGAGCHHDTGNPAAAALAQEKDVQFELLLNSRAYDPLGQNHLYMFKVLKPENIPWKWLIIRADRDLEPAGARFRCRIDGADIKEGGSDYAVCDQREYSIEKVH